MKNKILLMTAFIALIFTACSKVEKTAAIKQNNEGLKVQTAPVQIIEGEKNLSYSGVIEPSVTTTLGFQLPGTVERIYADEGRRVGRGTILAVLDKGSYQSTYDAALAMQKQAQDAYQRMKTVYESGSLPEIQWEEIKSKVEQANSTAMLAKRNLDNCYLKAPSSGVIGSRNIELGSNAMPGVPAFELVNINTVYVKISVPENEITKIQKGMKADVIIPAVSSEAYPGVVDKIGVLASTISKTYEVKLKVQNKGLVIKPGMACDVELSLKNIEPKLTVPYRAVVKDHDDKDYVYLIDPANKTARKKYIELGRIASNGVEVKAGLSEGDLVVIGGLNKLEDNARVLL